MNPYFYFQEQYQLILTESYLLHKNVILQEHFHHPLHFYARTV